MAVRGEGCWIIAADGRRYLDASGQAAVVNIGHGVKEIGEAIAAQTARSRPNQPIEIESMHYRHRAPTGRPARRTGRGPLERDHRERTGDGQRNHP